MIFRRINDETLNIEVGDNDIDVKLTFDTPTYKMLMAGDLLDRLYDCLDCSFNQHIDIVTEEDVLKKKRQ